MATDDNRGQNNTICVYKHKSLCRFIPALFLIFVLASASNEPRSNGSLKMVQEDFSTRDIVTWDNPVLESFRLKLMTGFVLASILAIYVT